MEKRMSRRTYYAMSLRDIIDEISKERGNNYEVIINDIIIRNYDSNDYRIDSEDEDAVSIIYSLMLKKHEN